MRGKKIYGECGGQNDGPSKTSTVPSQHLGTRCPTRQEGCGDAETSRISRWGDHLGLSGGPSGITTVLKMKGGKTVREGDVTTEAKVTARRVPL